MARPGAALILGPDETQALRALAEGPASPPPLARAARILLQLAEGRSGVAIARELAVSPQTVCAWRMRFRQRRLAALELPAAVAPAAVAEDPAPQPVTLQRIAALVGVHKSTVHRVLQHGGEDDSPLAQRVRIAACELGYRPGAAYAVRQGVRRHFRAGDARRQVLCFLPGCSFRSPYHLRLWTGITDILADSGYDLLLRLAGGLIDRQLPAAVARGEVAAVITSDNPNWLGVVQGMLAGQAAECRPALIGLLSAIPGAWSVHIDFHHLGRQVMGHLLDLGHRRLIAIEERPEYTDGFRAELAARGFDPAGLLACHMVAGPGSMEDRLAATLRRLQAGQPGATAFLAPNDPIALMAVGFFTAQGHAVPAAMSVVGFDDTHALPGPGGANRLTSVALPLEELGQAAARLAMDPGPVPRQVLLPGVFRLRDTTARAPGC